MRRPTGIRARLTLWYAFVLAVFLLVCAAASYALLARSSRLRIDESLQETARAFAAAWVGAQLAPVPRHAAVGDIVRRIGAGDLEVLVIDRSRGAVADQWPADVQPTRTMARAVREMEATLVAASAVGGYATVPAEGGAPARRIFALPMNVAGRRQLVVVGRSLADYRQVLHDVRIAFLVAIPLTVLLAGAGGYFLASRALAPMGAMAAQAERIGASTLHERLDLPNPGDELGRMGAAFNDLLARLDASFEQQRQFMADASHELRTPITVIRGEADVALSRADREAAEYREALDLVRDEARRMSRIVDDLLLLARADVGQAPLHLADIYLDDVVEDAVRAVRTLASTASVRVDHAASDDELPIRGDEQLLRRLVLNLLENAIKYGRHGGVVTVRTEHADGGYVIAVHNEGAPIPRDAWQRVFERFHRGPGPRTAVGEQGAGAGLGLAIARWIAEVHGGTVVLAKSDESGTEFRATLQRGS